MLVTLSVTIQYNFQQFPLKEFAVTEFQLIFVQNDLEEVRKLLSLGAEANTQDYSGWTPLQEAAQVTFFRLKEKNCLFQNRYFQIYYYCQRRFTTFFLFVIFL
jgi:hypothetical protein